MRCPFLSFSKLPVIYRLSLGLHPGAEDVLIGPKRGQRSSDLAPTADCMSPTYVCVCVCVREREWERERQRDRDE